MPSDDTQRSAARQYRDSLIRNLDLTLSDISPGKVSEGSSGLSSFLPRFGAPLNGRAFSVQNGAEQLAEVFSNPTLSVFEDGLIITEARPVVDYLESIASFDGEARPILQQIENAVADEIARNGAFRVTKEVGIFRSVKKPEPPIPDP